MDKTLDDIIADERKLAKDNFTQGMLCHANPDDEKLELYVNCGKYHDTLAELLEELKDLREFKEKVEAEIWNKIYEAENNIRSNIIYDFADKLKKEYNETISTSQSVYLFMNHFNDVVDGIANQIIKDVKGIVDKRIISKSIEYYGVDTQSTVCMEECSELIQAISKEKRGINCKEHLAEEMADVIICLEILKQIYEVSDSELSDWIDKKMRREAQRIKY